MKKIIPLSMIAVFLFSAYAEAPALPAGKLSPSASADKSSGEPDCGDTIVVASIGDARTLVPILASDSASGDICGLVFNGLVKYDKNINIIGDLAESWDIQDNGLTIIFHLRKNVLWHDGEHFSAADVEFTYKKLIDPAVKTPYGGDFLKVKNFSVIDDYTIKVSYSEPFAPALASWGMYIMPKHILEKEDLNKTEFSRRPIGTGPYKFKRWRTGELIELEYNADYFEGRPYIDRYIYRIIPDQATTFLELSTQGIDEMGLSPLQYTRQTDTKYFKSKYKKYRYPSFGYSYLGYNLNDPRFKDKRVRQAIDYAIDKNEIIEGVLLGLGRACTGPFIPESWAYNSNINPRGFNPGEARRLLEEAGWRDSDKDGFLDKDGVKLEFTLMTNQGNDQRKESAEIIQRRLKDIGINVKIKIVEWSVFISEFIDKRRFEAILLGWSLSRDPDQFDIWHSSKTREGEFNFISYKNDEVDRLLEEGRRTFDQEKRKEIYNRLHEILYDEQPYTFLYIPDALPIVHSRFRGIEPSPIGIGYNIIKWYVPHEEQKYKISR